MKIVTLINTVLISILLIFLIFFQERNISNFETEIITIDSNWVKQEIQNIQFDIPEPEIVYLDRERIIEYRETAKPINNFYRDSTTIINNNGVPVPVNFYEDSISNKDGTFKLNTISTGDIFGWNLDYQLNQLEINKTIEKTILHRRFSAVGGFSYSDEIGLGINLGGMWQGKKGHGLSYQYELLNKQHSINAVFPIFNY